MRKPVLGHAAGAARAERAERGLHYIGDALRGEPQRADVGAGEIAEAAALGHASRATAGRP